MIKEKLYIVPIDDKRVELWVNNCDMPNLLIAELHPKHAEDLLKVYNRSEESYDALY